MPYLGKRARIQNWLASHSPRSRLKTRYAEMPQKKRNDVCALFVALLLGRADTVAGVIVDAQQHRLAARCCCLQPGRHLPGFPPINAGNVESRCGKYRPNG